MGRDLPGRTEAGPGEMKMGGSVGRNNEVLDLARGATHKRYPWSKSTLVKPMASGSKPWGRLDRDGQKVAAPWGEWIGGGI